MICVSAALLVAFLPKASAGLFGNNLGVGLVSCEAQHPLLLLRWAYNATEATIRATDATRACRNATQPNTCSDTWCLSVDNTLTRLPPSSGGVGAGVFVEPPFAGDELLFPQHLLTFLFRITPYAISLSHAIMMP